MVYILFIYSWFRILLFSGSFLILSNISGLLQECLANHMILYLISQLLALNPINHKITTLPGFLEFDIFYLSSLWIVEWYESNQIKPDYLVVLFPLPKLEVNNTELCLEKGLVACRQYGSIFALILIFFSDFFVILNLMIFIWYDV